MNGEVPGPEQDQIQQPISERQYYAQVADELQKEHTAAFLAYQEAARNKAHDLNKRREILDQVEARMKAKAEEARRVLGDPEVS